MIIDGIRCEPDAKLNWRMADPQVDRDRAGNMVPVDHVVVSEDGQKQAFRMAYSGQTKGFRMSQLVQLPRERMVQFHRNGRICRAEYTREYVKTRFYAVVDGILYSGVIFHECGRNDIYPNKHAEQRIAA